MGRVALAAVNVLAVVIGCGGAPSTETLTASDVTNIPPGTAVGAALSGSYVLESGGIDACNCRVGPCSFFHPGIGEVLNVSQQDGSLTITAAGATTSITGGVNADDTFTCGGTDLPSYLSQGAEYGRETGRFSLSGGQPTGFSWEADITVTGSGSGLSFDCDLRGSFSAAYQGP